MTSDYQGKTAVVTGGASGVGRCLCERFAREGMNVIMADVEADTLETEAAALREMGLNVVGIRADVTDPESMDQLAERSSAEFGNVHILCNNAGVGIKEAQRRMWTLTPNDWTWGFNVNVMGIANGVRAFVPAMLAHGEPGHVVNTSSGNGGLSSLPTTPIYASTKAAVTSMTEVLHYQFLQENAALQAHLLFPGPHLVNTRILSSMRNRPTELRDDNEPAAYNSMADLAKASGLKLQLTEPEEVAETCLQGIRDGQFWILPASERQDNRVNNRTQDILNRANPQLPEE
ncbi:SDR family NAD(P)-dependent oxidoreductase [Halieaceae bacterium IMCC14734]|uniref:SDR family NAD(P)-dependent oxidoreductase n=1 Tax=Candidatus Litorirhabdus singularis TaxID=2518993 RepID=A0ABT3TJL6_9GAMM|nr:SDR family NAD(P)-dependent oxidoreductase [Candidatus Litorirhabdus singularis]MCX2982503.1 SDR family NAD(P)-dependent oxidoreductase [Candidatus Litorirhabdus singularis]